MNCLLIIFLIILWFQCIWSQYEKPKIYPKKKFIVVDSGTNLTLGCVGKEPVKWTFAAASNFKVFPDDNIIINIESESKSDRNKTNYEIITTVVNVSPRNVGFYYCHAKKGPYTNWVRSQKIYVYVRDEKQISLFPYGTIERHVDNIGDIVVIPCLPTSPEVSVTVIFTPEKIPFFIKLYSNGNINKFPKHVVNNFSPMHGLELFLRYDAEVGYCIFKRNNIFEVFDFMMINDQVFYSLKPHIEGADVIDAQLGGNFTLNCTDIVNPDMFLMWTYPNISNLERISVLESSRVNIVDGRNQFGTQLVISTLNIKNVTQEIEGKYECRRMSLNAENEPDAIYFAEKYVVVVDRRLNKIPKIIYPKEKEIHVKSSTGKQIQVNATENVELICEGLEPVTWNYNDVMEWWNELLPKNDELINKTESENGFVIYKSILKLKYVEYRNTGFYNCHALNTIKNNPYKSDSIYMFIKDVNNLYSPYNQYYLFFIGNTNLTVPCRPSSPEVQVSLELFSGELVPADYDPRVGYTVNMTFNENVDFRCHYELDGHNETESFVGAYTHYFRYETYTYLDTPKDNTVYLGDELNLYCKVLVASNIFQIPIWVIPKSNRTINHLNTSVESISVEHGKVIISKLTIKKVQHEDEGEYGCYLPITSDPLSRNRTKYINVFDQFDTEPSIDDFKNNGRAYIGSDMILSCSIEFDHNIEFNIRWSLPNNIDKKNKTSLTTKLVYIPTIYGTLGQSSLKIKNVTFENQGNYTCTTLDSFNNEKTVTLDVIVKRPTKPKISVSNVNVSTMSLTVGQSFEMFCFAEGNPAPKILWKKDQTIISEDNTYSIRYVKPSDAGLYTCNASTYAGWDIREMNLDVPISYARNEILLYMTTIPIAVLGIIIVTVLLIMQEIRIRARRNDLIEAGILDFETGKLLSLNPNLNIVDQAMHLPYDRKWDIPWDRIKLGNELGSGYYGVVLQGEVSGIFRGETIKTVAVKMVKQNSDYMSINALISELKLMTHIGRHINVVNLLGACTENINRRQLLVIVEYCKYGNVRHYLIQNRDSFIDLINSNSGVIESTISIESENNSDDKQITTLDLVSWSFQIARGMAYLASRKILHGDLAARNILLSEDNIVKISDFGLSKNMRNCKFYKKKNNKGPMPIKWMAIEAIRDGISTTQSDVWSFGIVLWELFSLGRTPYPEMETDFTFFNKISQGYRMEPPQYSTQEVYKIMLECWNSKPVCRPTFTELVEKFKKFLQEHANRDYLEICDYDEDQNIPDFFSAVSSTDHLSVMSNNRNLESTTTQELIPMVTIR